MNLLTNFAKTIAPSWFPAESASDKIIREGNQKKDKNAPAIVILQSNKDHNGFFGDTSPFLVNLESVSKTHYIYKKFIDHKNIGQEIELGKQKLGNRKIDILWLRGHGLPHSTALGKEVYARSDVKSEDFEKLDPETIILLESCSTGSKGGLAERIAEVQKRTVYAPKKDITELSILAEKNRRIELECYHYGRPTGVKYENKTGKVVQKTMHAHAKITAKLRKKAGAGSIHDQYVLALRHVDEFLQNNKNRRALKRAIRSLKKIAEELDPAKFWLTYFLLLEKNDPTVSKSSCVDYFVEKANSGNPKAAVYVGYCYEIGLGVAKDRAKAIDWYHKAAQEKNGVGAPAGLLQLAHIYESESPALAAHYFSQLCNSEDPSLAETGKAGLIRFAKKSFPEAPLTFYEAFAVFHTYPIGRAIEEYGRKKYWPKKKIFEELKIAAVAHSDAQTVLGSYYEKGLGTEKSLRLALDCQNRAYSNHSMFAAAALGRMHEKGIGVAPNWRLAAEYYAEGGERGDPGAKNALIRIFKEQTGGEASYEEAFNWKCKGFPGIAFRQFLEQ